MSFWQNLTKIGGIIVNFCLLTSVKIDFLPVNYTTVIWASQWCYQLLISFREVPSFNFIPYLDDKMLLQWYKPLPQRAGKQRFAKKNELVNMYVKRQHITATTHYFCAKEKRSVINVWHGPKFIFKGGTKLLRETA